MASAFVLIHCRKQKESTNVCQESKEYSNVSWIFVQQYPWRAVA